MHSIISGDVEAILIANNLICMNLGYKDVFLSYFYNSQEASNHLVAGEVIKVDQQGCMNQMNQRLLMFSRTFKAKLEEKMRKGYCIKSAKVNYVVYWKQEDAEEEVRVVLPEIEMVMKRL